MQINQDIEHGKRLLADNNKVYCRSHYNFITQHNGFRPGKMHLVLGTPGGGKSTLMRSMLLDVLEATDLNVLYYLSEESADDLSCSMAKTGFKDLENLYAMSETTLPAAYNTRQKVWDYFTETVEHNNIEFIFFDNITTSTFYMDLKAKEQSDFAVRLKKFAEEKKIYLVIAAHTNSDCNESMTRLINETDIRGSRTLINLIEFQYILQRFKIKEHYYPTIQLKKYRGQDVEHTLFSLRYSKEHSLYVSDKPLNFNDFKEAFKKRNVL